MVVRVLMMQAKVRPPQALVRLLVVVRVLRVRVWALEQVLGLVLVWGLGGVGWGVWGCGGGGVVGGVGVGVCVCLCGCVCVCVLCVVLCVVCYASGCWYVGEG